MLEIVADEENGRILRLLVSNRVPRDADAAIVLVNYHGEPQDRLNEALNLAKAGRPVVMVSFREAAQLASYREFHLVLSYPHTSFAQLVMESELVADMLNGLLEGRLRRHDNPLLRQAYELPEPRGLELHRPSYAPLAGERFDVACCDVSGTLLRLDGRTVDQHALDWVEEQAAIRPVVLWTGGDLKDADTMLRRAGITYPLIPKQVMRKATVTAALDDEPQKRFSELYGVHVEHYTHFSCSKNPAPR